MGSAGVAGALIGLLFVAVSVTPETAAIKEAAEIRSIRAVAALTAFTNALTVSLTGLVPGAGGPGLTAAIVAIFGVLFILGAIFEVTSAWRAQRVRLTDLIFLVGLAAVFVIQFLTGLQLHGHPRNLGDLQTICDLVIACFLIGIARTWELVGGPNVELSHQLFARFRARRKQG
jgi:hypothetical protein